MVKLAAPLGEANVFIERNQKISRYGVYMPRKLVRAMPSVLLCIMNVNNQDQVLSEGNNIGHGEPAAWAAAIDDQKPQLRRKQDHCKQLKELVPGPRSNVSLIESQALEELIANYEEVFETKS
jgi:hypothetical protein